MRGACPILLLAVLGASPALAQSPRVALELVTRAGLPPTAPQEWYQALSNLGFSSLRIRSGTSGDAIGIQNQGTKAAPSYKVVGMLSADNMLNLPGGKFGLKDTGKLRKWLDNLRDLGTEGVTAPRAAFGLTPSQLQEVHDDLKRSVGFSTKGMAAGTAIARIGGTLGMPLELDAGSNGALARVEVADELKGLSCGTSLAAIARPAGLVLAPRRASGGPLVYRIGKPQAGSEAWPVGWMPKQRPAEVLPLMFELLNVEIKEIPVSEAVEAVEGRLEVPFLFDRNAMALYGADPTSIQADVPSRKMTYSRVLDTVLMQARLKYELRLDEADKPFLWITTVKPAP